MICIISFNTFSDVLPGFTCTSAVGNHGSVYLGVNVLRLKWSETLSEKPLPSIFIGNILLSKALRTLSLPSKRLYTFLRTASFSCFFSGLFGFSLFLKFKISTNKSL